ncbi:hypothetical protein NLJ89_g8133 [Agrocybe chaxingu]|uniref:Uncharacterized protein n=1 Tax=Agrocybe chaxingu TaxID=84603 RepID=A0A9W8JVZ1_9AGAR|nr:hypothetical protein NLJ89_g8133 [Agrocybe chaxingu]
MLALIEHSPDIYLDELQEQLFLQHDIKISLDSISRTLKRLGMSSKKSAALRQGVLLNWKWGNIPPNILLLQMKQR